MFFRDLQQNDTNVSTNVLLRYFAVGEKIKSTGDITLFSKESMALRTIYIYIYIYIYTQKKLNIP